MSRQQLRRYIWLIDTVRSAGANGITFEEINQKWMRSTLNDDGKVLPLRTFHDQRAAILEEFDIDIECDRRDNTYRLSEEYSEYGSVKSTLIDALILNNAIREAPELNNSVVFNAPFHHDNLAPLLRAVKEHKAIRFRHYHNLKQSVVDHQVELEVYGLYFCSLWFAVGKSVKYGTIQLYALHHMSEIKILESDYTIKEDFNVQKYMDEFTVDDVLLVYPQEFDDALALDSIKRGNKFDYNL